MEMMLAAAAASADPVPMPSTSNAAAMSHHHYQTYPPAYHAYPPPPPPVHHHHHHPQHPQQQQQQQQLHTLPPPAPTDSSAKRKRVKKSDDEWAVPAATAAPPVAPTSSMSISSLVAPPPAFAMPVASSSAASLSSILSAASPIPSAPSPTVSVFQAPPVPIQSFAETERQRRTAANGSASAAALGNGKSANASGSSSSRKSDSRNTSSNSSSTAAPQLSMLDLFFPDTPTPSLSAKTAAADANGASKSLKRKRRSDPALAAPNNTNTNNAAAAVEYDMLRFGVDSTKLIPQGLVDRVDAKMDRAFIAKLIESHVANWTKRAGFSVTFLADATTLLTAYYPCHYPTILDEVLACFLFKRPEVCVGVFMCSFGFYVGCSFVVVGFMSVWVVCGCIAATNSTVGYSMTCLLPRQFTDMLLAPMVEKLQKLNESATGAKYPVVDALARTCVPLGPLTDRARHDFACTTLLQTLVERNTDKFVLSPAIAACAVHCSDAVVATLARQLLCAWLKDAASSDTGNSTSQSTDNHANGSSTASNPPSTPMWRIVDANEQAFELLDEEKKLRARSGDASLSLALGAQSSRCRLACALVRLVLLDSASLTRDESALAALQTSPLVQHALALVLSVGSVADTSALLLDRVRRLVDTSSSAARARGSDEAESPVAALLACLVSACTATTRSVPTTNWFSRHVLRFLLSSDAPVLVQQPERRKHLLALVVERYLPLVLGAPVPESDDNDDPATQDSRNDATATTTSATTDASQSALAIAEKLSVTDMAERLRRLLALLTSVPLASASAFLDAWTAAWTSATRRVAVPWAYLHALVLVAVDDELLTEAAHACVRDAFHACVTQVCRAQFACVRASRLVDVLHLVLASSASPQTQTLLLTVVDAMRMRDDASATLFTNAVLVRLSEGATVSPSDASLPASKRSGSSLKSTTSSSSSLLGAASSAASPRADVERHVLVALRDLAARDDATGAFVRAQLSSRAALRLLTQLLRDVATSPSKLRALVELLEAVAGASVSQRQGDSAATDNGRRSEWLRHHVIQQLVASAYNAQSVAIADRLVGLLQRLAQRQQSPSDASTQSTLLWATLRQCTQLCCGCGAASHDAPVLGAVATTVDSRRQHHVAAAAAFAELVKLLLLSTTTSSSSSHALVAPRVAAFVQQELVSCRASAPRLNLFLLLVLQKLASVPQPPSSCLAAVQLAVFSLGATSRDHIRILQLQLLKALCARLVRLQTRARCRGVAFSSSDEQQRCEELVCNERLQLDLRRIVNAEGVGASSSRASVVLAQGVLAFAAELHRSKQQQQRAVLSR